MKRKKKLIVCMVMAFALLLSGCQKTPEKSSVVNKAEGLSEELIAEPLKSGEKEPIDMPEHWSAAEKRSENRVTISADLDLGMLETGNLPVVEIENHAMTQKELKKLVGYFAGGEELYVPQVDTKEVFQKIKDRIDNSEGVYANPVLGSFTDLENSLSDAIELAPMTLPNEQKAELKFQKKTEDVVKGAANSWITNLGIKQETIPDAEVFFSADVGENRLSHIEAQCYDPNIENSSQFVWKTGTDGHNLDYIQQCMRMNEFSTDTSGYKEKFQEILNQYEAALEQETVSQEEGQKQAERILKELGVSGMSLFSSDKTLWFPEEEMPDVRYGQSDDFFWQADLEKAKVGYQYVFTRAFGELSVDQSYGLGTKTTADTYTAPFPVEKVTILITDDGVKTFSWKGMCEEVATIAENVKVLPFDDIQEHLFEQIFYYYLQHGQPTEDMTNFTYKVTSAKLGYTYVTAFKNPQNAWLVPTWFFEVLEGSGAEGDVKDMVNFPIAINAMDGGVIEALGSN